MRDFHERLQSKTTFDSKYPLLVKPHICYIENNMNIKKVKSLNSKLVII